MNSDLNITSEQRQADVPVTVFRLRGWLDAQSEEQLLEDARIAYDGGARYLLLDMSDLDTLTSAGMRAIQKVYQIFTPKEDQFKIAHLKHARGERHQHGPVGVGNDGDCPGKAGGVETGREVHPQLELRRHRHARRTRAKRSRSEGTKRFPLPSQR